MSSEKSFQDLLESLRIIGFHPAVGFEGLDGAFVTITSSTNWKTMVIGLIPPPNNINYYPVMRCPAVVPLAEAPPQERKPKNTSKKKGSGVDAKQTTSFSRDEFRQTVIDEFTRLTGSSPSDELLSLLCAHAWAEMGATSGWFRRDGTYVKAPLLRTLNNNIGGVHAGPGSIEGDTVEIPGTGNNVFYVDSHGVTHELDPKTGKPIKPNDTIWAMPGTGRLAGKMVVADPTKSGNKKFYENLKRENTYIDTDTSKGVPYLVAFRSHGTMQDGVSSWLSLLVNRYPGFKDAKDAEQYATALLNGKDGSAYFDKTIGPTSIGGSGFYIKSLEKQLQSYRNEYPDDSNSSMTNLSSVDPNQRIQAFGGSTDPEDPLGSIWGRNISADTARFEKLQENIEMFSHSITLMEQIPPLVLLINPQEFKRNYENAVDFGIKTRNGNIVHTWLERPVRINASGVSAAQYAIPTDISGGLTNYNRVHSLSYRNLMSLVLLYKNNGVLYGFPGESDGTASLVGSVYIIYDDHLYIGSFDSFAITDAADKPHNLAYSFEFTVRYDIHRS